MIDHEKRFVGAIPDVYDSYMVPLIFESCADDLARMVASWRPQSVLETAAGSGVVTRALAPLLDGAATYTATDLNPPMLERAKQRQPDPGRIIWQQADALALPFAEGAFDTVLCQFGVMFFPDKIAGFAEACRVLRPGGSFVFNVWDDIARNAFPHVVEQAMRQHFPQDPPLFMGRIPHGYHDLDAITDALQVAGFGAVRHELIEKTATAATPRDVAIAFCQGTPLRSDILARDPDGLERATDIAEQAIAERFGAGPVSGPIRGYLFVATR